MSDDVPGLYISRYVERGQAYVMDLAPMRLPGRDGTKRGLALHPDDWGRLTPAQREQVRDKLVRRSADDGLRALERFLGPLPGDRHE